MKVAFQAGVLQVLLSEKGLRFDHYDSCSGGAFNLAMLCNGWSGIKIADTWRRHQALRRCLRPVAGPRPRALGRAVTGDHGQLPAGLQEVGPPLEVIRSSSLDATFTVYNWTRGERQVFTPADMDEDRLVACLSQAVWFPPVVIDGEGYTDAVFDTDANVDAALERDVDEIWVIWTVSKRPEWMPGLMAQFFHALEESANGTLASDLARIQKNNDDRAAGRPGCFGRKVTGAGDQG